MALCRCCSTNPRSLLLRGICRSSYKFCPLHPNPAVGQLGWGVDPPEKTQNPDKERSGTFISHPQMLVRHITIGTQSKFSQRNTARTGGGGGCEKGNDPEGQPCPESPGAAAPRHNEDQFKRTELLTRNGFVALKGPPTPDASPNHTGFCLTRNHYEQLPLACRTNI